VFFFITLPHVDLKNYISCFQTTLHYTTLHYATLHYTTPHHTTLHYTPLQYTPLHFNTLHYNYTTLHHTTPHHNTTLHYTPPHNTTPHHITPHHTTPDHTTPHHTTPHHSTHLYCHQFRWVKLVLSLSGFFHGLFVCCICNKNKFVDEHGKVYTIIDFFFDEILITDNFFAQLRYAHWNIFGRYNTKKGWKKELSLFNDEWLSVCFRDIIQYKFVFNIHNKGFRKNTVE